MIIKDIGPRAYHKSLAAASSTFTPLFDRAAYVRRVIIDNPSANDVWIISCTGRELLRFPVYTVGNQQLLGGPSSAFPKTSDLFAFFKLVYGQDYFLPVPQGTTLTVASVGGATANIIISFEERNINDVAQSMLNHPTGNHFVMPVFGSRAANITVLGENALDTQIGPSWLPNLWIDNELPANFQVNILALFLEGGGRNTFSGAADHQSVTDHLALIYNGQRMFTRDAADGIPLVGQAAAAGSANSVYGSIIDPFPAFQLIEYVNWTPFEVPLALMPGSLMQWRLAVTGDVTGGASYVNHLQCMLVDIRLAA